MRVYYNEFEPYAADWLENLIAAGHLPLGDVDRRDIQEVQPHDLEGYDQCHFFAGIGGWPYALELAGWQGPVWTGSPPCQDYSIAGSIWNIRKGIHGERGQLTRSWLDLVAARRPGAIMFENVPGIKPWIAEITGRLEGAGYGIFQRERAASCIGAPSIRRRVWVAAYRHGERWQESGASRSPSPAIDAWRTPPGDFWPCASGWPGRLANGLPGRVAQVRAYGNAIVPQVAAEFVTAYMEAKGRAIMQTDRGLINGGIDEGCKRP